MSILDQYGNQVSSASRHFANAADRYDRSHPPQPLFREDFEKLIPDFDRQFLVSGSRKLFQNYGPIKGAIVQKANNVVGRAWSAKFTGQDLEWGVIAKDWLDNQWYGNCDVRGRAWDFKTLLWLDSVAVDRDGDFLVYLTEAASGYPLTQRISCNRIGQRLSSGGYSGYAGSFSAAAVVADGPYKGAKISHGVIRNNLDRAIAYRILGDTPPEDKDISADRCIHVFDPAWHDQIRGIPSFSGAIKLVYNSLTATEREQMNQIIRSSYAFMEWNDTGGPDINDPSVSLGSDATANSSAVPTYENLSGGMIKYFRSNSGGKMEAVANDMPGDMWDRFQDRVVRMAMTEFDWPVELVWKSGEVNAALVRNLQERARISVEDRQDVIKSPALFQVRYAIAKAIKIGLLPNPKNPSDWWKWDFGMPRKFSIDPGKEAAQRREDFRIGFRSRTSIASEDGGVADQIEDEKIEDAFRFEKKIRAREAVEGFEVDRRQFMMMTPNEMDVSAEPAAVAPNDQKTKP